MAEVKQGTAEGKNVRVQPLLVVQNISKRFPGVALRWFSAGLTISERDTPDDPDIGCLNGRFRVRRALGLPMDRYDELSEERRRDYTDDAEEQRLLAAPDEGSVPLSVLYWPTGELESLLDRWPGLAGDYGKDHEEHRARVEHRLRHLAEAHSWLAVGHGTVEELVAFATERHEAPKHHMTRGLYGAQLAFTGKTTPWPPRRNDRCWCGSGLRSFEPCHQLIAHIRVLFDGPTPLFMDTAERLLRL